MTATIHHGDCLDVLRQMPDNSVHAIVTDPPYGLSNTTPDQVAETIVRWVSGERDYLPKSRGFMGKEWDGFVPPVAVWDEAMRVLKPGGHVLAFAGSRTHDLMTMGLRLAGFDIRDSVYWHYGSGMPKSHDIGKAIDKARDEDAEPRRAVAKALREALESSGKTRREIDQHFGTANVSQYWFSPDKKTETPPADKWPWLRDFLNIGPGLDAEVWRLNGRKGQPGENWGKREVVGTRKVPTGHAFAGNTYGGDSSSRDHNDTAPATDAAKQWEGWGTALKPATEPIVMARKPFRGTVAANVLEHGTGGLNIDGCRIPTDDFKDMTSETYSWKKSGDNSWNREDSGMFDRGRRGGWLNGPPSGRWPANVILDEHMAGVLDQMVPDARSSGHVNRSDSISSEGIQFISGTPHAIPGVNTYNDKGGASRFFKVAEADEHGAISPYFPREFDPPFMYAPKAPKKERPDVDGVKHPTVKPVSIMSWLVRLVTPPNGIVLDPFAGSGTTIEAAMLEGFQVIGIEREAEYLPLIRHRIERATEQLKTEQEAQAEAPDQGAFPLEDIA